ncbi:MAG: ferrous iron transporter B [Planctomycetota bacterium]|nr:ferrous iron transporter B [Planctomycetota bacterium]
MVDATSQPITRIALIGNPNAGKTTIFNALVRGSSRISNHPGITANAIVGKRVLDGVTLNVTDLPGTYSLELDLPEADLCRKYLQEETPDLIFFVLDAMAFGRNLKLLEEMVETEIPFVVVVTKTEEAQLRGHKIDIQAMQDQLAVPVVEASSSSRVRKLDLISVVGQATSPFADSEPAGDLSNWLIDLQARVSLPMNPEVARRRRARDDRLDRFFIHPWWGLVFFGVVMTLVFGSVFWLAKTPMDWIDVFFGSVGEQISARMAEGALRDFLVDGVVGGVAGTLVFLPQIVMLFFLVAILEETGYLTRAAFVADRWLRPFGLPGQSFVPLLSSHACAIPAIMCTRLIPDRRDRIATILVAPFLSCSARLPVYILLVGILFPSRPLLAACAFVGCYLLGAVAAVASAGIVRLFLLPGASIPMVMELPPYRFPSLKEAGRVALERGWAFLINAGTVILLICILLWWMSSYPAISESSKVTDLRGEAQLQVDPALAKQILSEADSLAMREATASSYAGQLGKMVEPVLAPVGADWQLSVAVVASFAAREVFVSSLNVLLGVSEDEAEKTSLERLRSATRDDGSPLLPVSAAGGLLVFYVLAMQCLPTLAVTRREAGGVHWALLQLGWMTLLAWVLGTLTRSLLIWAGVS